MTVSAVSLDNSGPYGVPGGTYTTASVVAPANSLLALWICAGIPPTATGLGLTWTVAGSVFPPSGALYLLTAEVGASEVSGEVTVNVDLGGAPYDLDCISGDDGESLLFGSAATGAVSATGGGNTASLTIAVGEPYLYLAASTVGWEDGSNGASPGEDPVWTQLALTGRTYGSYLETQVSPDGTNPNTVANWSNGYNGWGSLGIAVSAA